MPGHHHHDHDGAHGSGAHRHAPASFGRAFAIGTALNAGFVAAQVFYGLAAHSMALLADAVHNFGDVLGLLIAWGATVLARREPTAARTYGWGRGTILASLANAVVLLLGCGAIAVEAVQRFADPAADAAVSAGVVVAGLLIPLTGRRWLDPATSLAIVAVIALGTWGLLRDWLNLATDAVPGGIDPPGVEAALRGLPGVV